ncbi:MAG TPA: response regulator [Sphingomicrobium sp.]|jgi:FixJ family two-component response regulator|nr:response regulator [Sphingomicrobium sp.]
MAQTLVYLIDDDEATLASTQFLLGALGIAAVSFSDPFAFLQEVASLEPGCVLTDLRMPAMSGFELHAALRKKNIRWPVVLMSGHSALDSSSDALERGIFATLEKPFTRQRLVKVLDRAFIELRESAPSQSP